MLKVLEEDFARIPALLDRALDEPAVVEQPDAVVAPELESVQLGLF
jgi:hypothetical protein